MGRILLGKRENALQPRICNMGFIQKMIDDFMGGFKEGYKEGCSEGRPASRAITTIDGRAESPVVRRDSANPRYIAECDRHLTELSQIATHLCGGSLFSTIPQAYQHLDDYLKSNTNRSIPEILHYSVSFESGSNLRTTLEQHCDRISETILETYTQQLVPLTFQAIPEAGHLSSRYQLNQTVFNIEASGAQGSLKRNLGPVYSSLAELGRLQESLRFAIPRVQSLLAGRETNWGDVAMNFGKGVLSVAHPMIGIPLIIGGFFKDSEKDKQREQEWNVISQQFDLYLKQWDLLLQCYEPVYQRQVAFITEKSNQLLRQQPLKILNDLDAQGYRLKHAPTAYANYVSKLKKDFNIT